MIQIICAFKILILHWLAEGPLLVLHSSVLVPGAACLHRVEQLLLMFWRIRVVLILVFLEAVCVSQGIRRLIQATWLLQSVKLVSLRLHWRGLTITLRIGQV